MNRGPRLVCKEALFGLAMEILLLQVRTKKQASHGIIMSDQWNCANPYTVRLTCHVCPFFRILGWPSTEHGPRLSLEEASDASNPFMEGYDPLPTIPVQPLSWSDAYPLLFGLENHAIPLPEWQGGLNFTYQ